LPAQIGIPIPVFDTVYRRRIKAFRILQIEPPFDQDLMTGGERAWLSGASRSTAANSFDARPAASKKNASSGSHDNRQAFMTIKRCGVISLLVRLAA